MMQTAQQQEGKHPTPIASSYPKASWPGPFKFYSYQSGTGFFQQGPHSPPTPSTQKSNESLVLGEKGSVTH